MAIDIDDPNMKKVMSYVSDRINKQHLRGIDLFRAVEIMQPGLVEVSAKERLDEVAQIRKNVQKELHSRKKELVVGDISKIKPNKQTGRQK